MSFIGDLFGGGSSTPTPTPSSAAPRISDAASESAGLEETSRQRSKFGVDQTILTSGLGDNSTSGQVYRANALGGNSSIS